MLRGIDISNWQGGMVGAKEFSQVDFVIVKATEGTDFVDAYCDGWVQELIGMGKLWGFYHFAGGGAPEAEARFFMDNTINYFGQGIPVLDWEGNQNVDWVNRFVKYVHDETGVWPWIYANPWRFNQGGVEQNCMRWVASYPDVYSPSFDDAESWEPPYADGLVGAWQFCSDGRLPGCEADLDFDLFYGNSDSWSAYVGNGRSDEAGEPYVSVLENDDYIVMVKEKR